MEAIIIRYGIVAILFGAGIEGEPFALAGGVLVHRGLLPWWQAMVAAIAGSCLFDQFWFHLARYLRSNRWIVGIAARPAFARATGILERHPVPFVLLFRFAYGLRTISPVAIGASRIPVRLFVSLNVVAAAMWGTFFTAMGYCVGPAFDGLIDRFGGRLAIGVALVSAGALAFTLRRGRSC